MFKRLRERAQNTTAGVDALERLDAVHSEKAIVSRSMTRSIDAGAGVVMNLSAAGRIDAAGDVVITAGAAPIIRAGGDLHLEGGAAGVVVARDANVRSGFVGILIARRADIDSKTRVLLSTRQVFALAAGFGLVSALLIGLRTLLGRIAPRTQSATAEEVAPPSSPMPWTKRLGRWLLIRLLMVAVPVLALWIAYRRVRSRVDGVVRLFRR